MLPEKLINKYLFACVIIALGAFIIFALKEFFTAFLGAVVFYILFKDFMFKLTHKKNIKHPVAAIIIIVISFLIVVLPVGFLVFMLYRKAALILEEPQQVKLYMDNLVARLNTIPMADKALTKNLGENASGFITAHMGGVLNSSFHLLASLLMMYFLLYFLLVSTQRMEARILYYLPLKKSTILIFTEELVGQTYSNAIGVPAIGIIQGALSYGAYLIAGVPDAGLWGILTGFASIIPLVGTAIIWLPVSVFLFATGCVWQGIFIIVFFIIGVTNVDNIIRMIISKKIGDVHPVITVLGVILGLKFFSLPGLVFGPLLISYFIILLRLFNSEYLGDESEPQPVSAQTVNNSLVVSLFKKLMDAMYPPVKK